MGKEVKNSKITAQDIGTIDKLMSKGLTANEISEITGRSRAGVHNYMRLLRFVKDGKPIDMNPTRFCADALCNYAETKGYPEVINLYDAEPEPPHAEQTRLDLRIEDSPNVGTDSVLLRIAVALESIAKRLTGCGA